MIWKDCLGIYTFYKVCYQLSNFDKQLCLKYSAFSNYGCYIFVSVTVLDLVICLAIISALTAVFCKLVSTHSYKHYLWLLYVTSFMNIQGFTD